MDAQTWIFSDVQVDSVEVIAGRAFTFSESAALNSGITKEYLFTTPATKDFYLTVSAVGLLKLTLDLYEATARAGTNLKTALNRNRHSTAVTTAIVHEGVGAGADGTALGDSSAGGAKDRNRQVAAGAQHEVPDPAHERGGREHGDGKAAME
jgi:hypothetical protein